MVLKQRPPLLAAVSTAVLLVLGGAIAYLGLSQRLASLMTKLPAGMELVPDDALMTLTLATDERRWTRLRQLGTPESQQILDRSLVTWRDRIISANGYRFKTDIQPWIGDHVTLALLPGTDGDSSAPEQVLLIPIQEPLKAQTLLSEPQENVTWIGRDYQGINVQSITTATGDTLESAVLGNQWLVIASGASGMEAVIDSFSGGPSMLSNEAYRQAIKHFKMPAAFAQVYINTPVAAQAFAENDTWPEINGLVAAVDLLPNGLDIEAATWLGPEDQPIYQDMTNTRSQMSQRLPTSTVFMVSTSSIEPMWQALKAAERLETILPISPVSLTKGLEDKTGLNFENDILPWLAGEMAFGLLSPDSTTKAASTPMGQLVLLAEVDEPDAAQVTWEQLEEVMVNRFRFDLQADLQTNPQTNPQTNLQTGTLPINQLVSRSGGIAMGYGWLDNDVTFFGVGADLLDAIAPSPAQPLPANRAFQTLLDRSPQESSGYLFIDVERIRELKGILPFPTLPDAPVVSAIKSIGVTTSVQDERSLRYDIFVELPKRRRIKPLPKADVPEAPKKDASKDASEDTVQACRVYQTALP